MRHKLAQVIELIAGNATPENAAAELELPQAEDLKLHQKQSTVVQSLPYALYSFLANRKSFKDCVYCAVLQGGDRDTMGAMAGAFSGAYLGGTAIPKNWVSRLENLEMLEDLAKQLNKLSV